MLPCTVCVNPNTAGTYVCNSVAYVLAELLAQVADSRDRRGGFVHVPRLPEQVGPDGPALATERSARALEVVLGTALSTTVDVREQAGTLA